MDSHLGDSVTLIKLNHAFHITLYGASGRRHLCELTSMLRYRTQHYLVAFITEIGGMPQAQAEHRAIIEACQRGDAEAAATVMYNHVSNVGSKLIEYVRR
jgi:DNA-binding GntR family transcriptional regulator